MADAGSNAVMDGCLGFIEEELYSTCSLGLACVPLYIGL